MVNVNDHLLPNWKSDINVRFMLYQNCLKRIFQLFKRNNLKDEDKAYILDTVQ